MIFSFIAIKGITRIRYVEPASMSKYIKKNTVFHYVKSPYTLIIKYLINHSLSVSSATGNSSEPITAATMATTVMVIPLEILDKNGT